jgi:hypothetical protein
MKKNILLIGLALSTLFVNAQDNFKWNVKDSVEKTKSQIYSNTKEFIAKTWNSAQNVIQNDDKDGGNIVLKGAITKKVTHALNVFTYLYNYTITFRTKDNKYMLVIDPVYCESAKAVGAALYDIQKIEPFDGEYVKDPAQKRIATLPVKKANPMMVSLKAELQLVVDSYTESMKKVEETNDDW